MFEQKDTEFTPMNEADTQGLISVAAVAHDGVATAEADATAVIEQPVSDPSSRRYAEAGRKGALRRHQLIQEGRLYEKEHGLKRGRQRLRQLIELGKLYEQEHGLNGTGHKHRKDPLDRMDADQLLKVFLRTFLRLTKPANRTRLVEVLHKLENEQNQDGGEPGA